MRLLNVRTWHLEDFAGKVPRYAIISHTWANEEVILQDIWLGRDIAAQKSGFAKLAFCASQATQHGLDYVWMDTCCLDKSSSAELSDAIHCMYRWYAEAACCFVYLDDVYSDGDVMQQFRRSRWFTRGWTLPELLAPKSMTFFSADFEKIGWKYQLVPVIHQITAIPMAALQGISMSQFSYQEKISWSAGRLTTRAEDQVYSLLGLLDISMPVIYGEGLDRATARLNAAREKIAEVHQEIVQPASLCSMVPSDTVWHEPFRASSWQLDDSLEEIPLVSSVSESAESPLDIFRGTIEWAASFRSAPRCVELQYAALSANGFRLLTIEPGAIGQRVVGHLREYDVLKPPSYYALSYVWGQEPEIHIAQINKTPHFIRPNLLHALQRVRLPHGTFCIWVDALSINQTDTLERNSQVSQMGTIYAKADGVMIWPGEADASSKVAIQYLKQITSAEFRWHNLWWEAAELLAVAELLDRTWFRRGWVVQEATFSTNSIFLCGDQDIHMDTFVTALRALRDRLAAITLPFDHHLAHFHDSPALKLVETATLALGHSDETGSDRLRTMTLESLVYRNIHCDTADHRDAIYAFLNLAKDNVPSSGDKRENHIKPDYAMPVLDIFADFINHCCERSKRLDMICLPWAPQAGLASTRIPSHRNLVKIVRHYPSWVATKDALPFGPSTWRSRRRFHGDPLMGRGSSRYYFSHYGTLPNIVIGRNPDGTCDGSLQATGLMVGEILQVSLRMADAIVTNECLNILRLDTSEGLWQDSVWRSLCADRDENGERAPHSYREALQSLLHVQSTRIKDTENVVTCDFAGLDLAELLDADLPEDGKTFLRVVQSIMWNRRTLRLRDRQNPDKIYVGIGPQQARIGDTVCILYGCSVPLVLRKCEATGPEDVYWQIVGDTYVHGIMDGEIIYSLADKGRSRKIVFVIR